MKKQLLIGACIAFATLTLSFTLELTFFDKNKIETNEANYSKVDKEKLAAILSNTDPAIWVFIGNSITQGAKHTHGMRSYPEIFSERVRFELGRSRDVVINTAISGNTTSNILKDFDWRVTQFRPKVVSLMIGTNDAAIGKNISIAEFRSNLILLISKIRKLGAVPIILSPSIIIVDEAIERSRLSEFVTEIERIAKKENVIFVDNYSNWNNELQVKYKHEVNQFLLNDPLHPNGLGHQEIAYAIFKELAIFNPKDPTCGGKYYEGKH